MSLEDLKKLSPEQQKALFYKVDAARKKGKSTNYSSMYGVGAAKLARELKVPIKEAQTLLKAYWKKNWAVRAFAEKATTKVVNGQQWVLNPVSGFWYTLRNEKDIWSTINQGTGVFCFDSWIRECRKRGIPQNAQFHDESISEVKKGEGVKIAALQKEAIAAVNARLKLNVPLDVTPQIGSRYSEIH